MTDYTDNSDRSEDALASLTELTTVIAVTEPVASGSAAAYDRHLKALPLRHSALLQRTNWCCAAPREL